MVTLAAIVSVPLGRLARREQREHRAIEALTGLGAIVIRNSAHPKNKLLARLATPQWDIYLASDVPTLSNPLPGGPRGTAIHSLPVSNFEVTDECMAHVVGGLKRLGPINSLTIHSPVLTDEGLKQLELVPEITWLELHCPLITHRAIDAIQKSLPNVKIVINKSRFAQTK
jgi:hypothetical protein